MQFNVNFHEIFKSDLKIVQTDPELLKYKYIITSNSKLICASWKSVFFNTFYCLSLAIHEIFMKSTRWLRRSAHSWNIFPLEDKLHMFAPPFTEYPAYPCVVIRMCSRAIHASTTGELCTSNKKEVVPMSFIPLNHLYCWKCLPVWYFKATREQFKIVLLKCSVALTLTKDTQNVSSSHHYEKWSYDF